MNINTARIILDDCIREELRDHAFGDVEVYWFKDGKEIATGYFGSQNSEVALSAKSHFRGNEARVLRECGTLGAVSRNDETGPEEFVLGETMPGLTLEDVRDEVDPWKKLATRPQKV